MTHLVPVTMKAEVCALFLSFFFLNHVDISENERVALQWLLSKFQSDFPGKLCISWDLHSTVAGKEEPSIRVSLVSAILSMMSTCVSELQQLLHSWADTTLFFQTLKVCDVRKVASSASTPPLLCLPNSGASFLAVRFCGCRLCVMLSQRRAGDCLGRKPLRIPS